jgi:hypothetical protein
MVALFSSLSCLLGTVLLCVASYKRVGILPSSFACRTRAQEEEYHPAATGGPFLFFISLDLSGCWSPWVGFIFQEIIYFYFGQLLLLLFLEQIRHFSGV